jgi:hypothetical protein
VNRWLRVEDLLPSLRALNDGGRHINGVVLHHTSAPTHAQWKGDPSVSGMLSYWEERRQREGWERPPGYHLLVSPGGVIYAPFVDLAPVLNANSDQEANRHCVAVSMVGNFDRGHDVLEGLQRHATLGLLGGLMERYGLPISHLHFHRDFPEAHKSCPGNSLDRSDLRGAVLLAQPWARPLLCAPRH